MPLGAVTEEFYSGTEGLVNGRRVILAGTTNYMGLTFDPDCIAAAREAVDKFGTLEASISSPVVEMRVKKI